jgi:hypothetical protein
MNNSSLIKEFSEIDTSPFPDFYTYEKPLERALWVLWVSKEKLGTRRLTAEQIASIVRDVQEISIDARSITNALNRASGKIHTYGEGKETYFEIMQPGKEHLLSQLKEGSVNVFYFEPDKKYTSKRILSKNILASLNGELRIVDPYCGQRCLDVLSDLKNREIRFLTRIDNLKEQERNRFLRELKDYKQENPNTEFRNYPNTDIHDRYVLSSDRLVILGHSIKDLGAKESFAIALNKDGNRDIVTTLTVNFDSKWEKSTPL